MDLQEMSLYHPEHLLGRSAEESVLLNAYFASLSGSSAAVILIHGESGLGKTKLAETLRQPCLEDDGYFVRGKFDQMSHGSANSPYSGISSAFADYCSAVESRCQEEREEVSKKLRKEIKGDERLLFEAIPSLRRIITGGDCYPVEEEEGKLESQVEHSSHRFLYLIRRIICAISSIGDPIVFLIDDVQWANKTEIEVLRALMMGATNPCTFIFTCRPGSHPFLNITDEFEGKTEISLKGLKRDAVRELVAQTLRINDVQSCTSLASFISRVTNDNPYFIRQQLMALKDDGLLRFGSDGWIWNVDEIMEEINDDSTSGDVVAILSLKMKRLPSLTKEALKICACIGSRIDFYILGLCVREMESCDREDNETIIAKSAISEACNEGLLVVTKNEDGVVFTHDSVREAAYTLLEPEERAGFHLRLGQILHKHIWSHLYEDYLFTISAQLARGLSLITDEEDRISTAHIFQKTGEKSLAANAFAEAHFFFAKGSSLLRDEDWGNHFRLCADIYLQQADSAALTTDFRDMDNCLGALFDKCKDHSPVDYLNASYIKVRALTARDDQAAVGIALEALSLVGETFPSQNLAKHTMLGFAQIYPRLKFKSKNFFFQLPPVTDKQMIATLRMCDELVNAAMGFNQELVPFLCFRMIKLSLKHGISPSLPSALALYGVFLVRFGFPLAEAATYGEIALSLQKVKLKGNESLANLTLLTWGITFTLNRKLSECPKRLQAGYDSGLKSGAISYASNCATAVASASLFSGQRLAKVASVLDQLRPSMTEYQMTRAIRANRLYRSVVDIFLGTRGSFRFCPTTGIDDSVSKANALYVEQEKCLQLFVAVIFRDSELAWFASTKLHRFGPLHSGTFYPYVCAFYRGMAAVSMLVYSYASKREFIEVLKSSIKQLRKGRKRGVENISHRLYLLEAEYAAFRKKHTSAKKFYLLAIEHAALAGVTFENAFTCEKFAEWNLGQENHDMMYKQIREAHRLYLMWGSQPKCEMLKKIYPKLAETEFAPISI